MATVRGYSRRFSQCAQALSSLSQKQGESTRGEMFDSSELGGIAHSVIHSSSSRACQLQVVLQMTLATSNLSQC